MTALILFSLFIAGLFVGSFLNLVADRLIKGGSIFVGHSKCDFCGVVLKARNLVPVLSFLFQKGRCAACRERLSLNYPFSEILTGAMFMLAGYFSQIYRVVTFQTTLIFVFLLVAFCGYIVIFLTDFKYQLIPDVVVYITIGALLVLTFVYFGVNYYKMYSVLASDTFGKYLLKAGFFNQKLLTGGIHMAILIGSALLVAGFFKFLIVITRGRGMGEGDVRLGLLVGLFNGVEFNFQRFLYDYRTFVNSFLAVFLAFLIGAVVSLVLILLRRKSMKDTVPFGPFLLAGSLVAYAFGSGILGWYYGLLL